MLRYIVACLLLRIILTERDREIAGWCERTDDGHRIDGHRPANSRMRLVPENVGILQSGTSGRPFRSTAGTAVWGEGFLRFALRSSPNVLTRCVSRRVAGSSCCPR